MTPMKKMKGNMENFHKALLNYGSVSVQDINGRDYQEGKDVDWTYYPEKNAVLSDFIKVFHMKEPNFSIAFMFDYKDLPEDEHYLSVSFFRDPNTDYEEKFFSRPILMEDARQLFKNINKQLNSEDIVDYKLRNIILNAFISNEDVQYKEEFDQTVKDFLDDKKENLRKTKNNLANTESKLRKKNEEFRAEYGSSDELALVLKLEKELSEAKVKALAKRKELDEKFEISKLSTKVTELKEKQNKLEYDTSSKTKESVKYAKRKLLKKP